MENQAFVYFIYMLLFVLFLRYDYGISQYRYIINTNLYII